MPTAEEIDFEGRWTSGESPPDVFVFLTDRGVADASLKRSILMLDQKYRWQQSTTLTVEEYLQHLPDVAEDHSVCVELILNEYRLRLDSNEVPAIQDFVRRFSDLGDTLRSRLLSELAIAAFGTDEKNDRCCRVLEIAPASRTACSSGFVVWKKQMPTSRPAWD